METGATFSKDKKYRYALWRIWDKSKPYAMFICLNPSTADEVKNDPTVTRCINYAKNWDYGSLYMTNLFAFRATNYREMKTAKEPIGEKNDYWLQKIANNAGIIIAAWGNHGFFMDRNKVIKKLIPKLYCLKQNKTGQPVHPLYQKKDLKPKTLI